MKVRHDLPFQFLSQLFGLSKKLVHRYFWQTAMALFKTGEILSLDWHKYWHPSCFFKGNASQKLWSDPNLTEAMKNKAFTDINSELDPYFLDLAGAFADPKWRQGKRRKPCVVCLDSTKIFCQKPSDATAQKELFSSDKHVNITFQSTLTSSYFDILLFSETWLYIHQLDLTQWKEHMVQQRSKDHLALPWGHHDPWYTKTHHCLF